MTHDEFADILREVGGYTDEVIDSLWDSRKTDDLNPLAIKMTAELLKDTSNITVH